MVCFIFFNWIILYKVILLFQYSHDLLPLASYLICYFCVTQHRLFSKTYHSISFASTSLATHYTLGLIHKPSVLFGPRQCIYNHEFLRHQDFYEPLQANTLQEARIPISVSGCPNIILLHDGYTYHPQSLSQFVLNRSSYSHPTKCIMSWLLKCSHSYRPKLV